MIRGNVITLLLDHGHSAAKRSRPLTTFPSIQTCHERWPMPAFKPWAYRKTYRQSGFHAQFGVGWPERGQFGKYRNFNKLRLR